MAKKKVIPRKKYALGTSGVSVKNYLQSPREALANNDILMSKAELEAQTNPLAMGVEMGTQVLSQLASSGALTKKPDIAAGVGNNGTQFEGGNFMTPEQQFAFESQRTIAAMGNPGIPAGEVELEGDEVIQTPNGQVAELKGPSHEQGGIPMEVGDPNSPLTSGSVPEDSEAFSKRVFKGGKNMADRKMSRERTKESLLSLLDSNKSDIAIKNTVNRKMANLEREEQEDLAFQEMASLFSQVQEFAYGTGRRGIKKYATGSKGIETDPINNLSAAQSSIVEKDKEWLNSWLSNRKIGGKDIPADYKKVNADQVYVDDLPGNEYGNFDTVNKNIILDNEKFPTKTGIATHELNHLSQEGNPYVQDLVKNPIEKFVTPKSYATEPTEIHSEIMRLRQAERYAPDKDVTLEQVKNINQRDSYNLKDIPDEDLLEILNTTASLDSEDNTTYAAYGTGKKGIKKYAGGTNGIQDPTKPWRLPFSTQADRPISDEERLATVQESSNLIDKMSNVNSGYQDVFNNEANQTASVNTSLVKTKEVNDIAAQALAEKKGEFTPRYGAPSKFYGKVDSTSFDLIAKAFIKSKGSTSNNLDFSDKENVKDLQKWIYGKEDGPEIDGMVGPDTITKGIARQNGVSPSGELMPEVKSIFESIPGLTPGTNPIPTVGGISNTFIGPDGVPVTIGASTPSSTKDQENSKEKTKRKGYVPTAGDLLTLAGTAYSAFAPMANTLENRAGDTPNVNEYKDFGKKSLDTLARAAGFLTQERDNSNRKVASASRGSKKAGRSGARGINQVRAMDLATDINTANAQADIDAAFANKTLGLLGQKATLQSTIDQVIMGGEQAADLADRQDRDNFYTQLGKDKASKGEGIQQLGKNVNTMLQNPILMNLLENMGQYVSMDANGNFVAKQMKTKKNNNTKTE